MAPSPTTTMWNVVDGLRIFGALLSLALHIGVILALSEVFTTTVQIPYIQVQVVFIGFGETKPSSLALGDKESPTTPKFVPEGAADQAALPASPPSAALRYQTHTDDAFRRQLQASRSTRSAKSQRTVALDTTASINAHKADRPADAAQPTSAKAPATENGPAPPTLARAIRFAQALPDNPPPPYPYSARARGIEGRVLLHIEVLEDGRSGAIDIAQSSGHADLDDAARRGVRDWRFVPAGGTEGPVRSVIQVPIRFRLGD